MTQKITVFLGIAVLTAVLFGGLTISQSAFAGTEPEPSTCQDCGDAFETALDVCGLDVECIQTATIDLANCSSSCTGNWDLPTFGVLTESCLYNEAAGLDVCATDAIDNEIVMCLEVWLTDVVPCSNTPASDTQTSDIVTNDSDGQTDTASFDTVTSDNPAPDNQKVQRGMVTDDTDVILDTASFSTVTKDSSSPSPQTSDIVTDDNGSGGDEHLTRPTFGLSHETFETIVDSGFRFNDQSFTINDNFHTPFAQQTVNIGEVNTFEAKIYADKRLKVQEFLFGIPNVGEAHLAELGVEVWYDYNGEIEDVRAVQKSNVIDKETIFATHEKTKCQASDIEEKCDITNVSMVFLEPLKDKIIAVKAIDYKNRYQITYLNEGVEIAGESLNPMNTLMIPSTIRDEGLVQVMQTAKYSNYWVAEDGRIFEMNNFGSFKQIDQTFERFQDTGNPYTRVHSGFGGIIAYEQKRALGVFDSSELISELPESFAYLYPESGERVTEEMKQKMLEQEEIAKKIIEESKVQARWH